MSTAESTIYRGDWVLSKPNPRRLIICCDGTWQSSVTDRENIPSNITRLARSFEPQAYDKKTGTWWQQIVYYDSGVGTGDAGGFWNIEGKRKGGTGDGLNENVIEAYNFIVNNYQHGDEISCFGFSRGAYTARAVAGLLTQIGVIPKWRMDFFPALYQEYKANTSGKPFRQTDAFKKVLEDPVLKEIGAFSCDVPIVKVVGTFDTVGALGIPDIGGISMAWFRKNHGFHNTGLDHSIHNAFQALALDEHRGPFQPTLWHLPPGTQTTRLEQCWFPGVHINIGGGSDDQIKGGRGDREQIATLTLAWMIDRCRPFLGFDEGALLILKMQHAVLTGDPSFSGFVDTLDPHAKARPKVDTADPKARPKLTWSQSFKTAKDHAASFIGYGPPAPDAHKIGYASGRIVDSFTIDYKPLGDGTRTPGVYKPQLLAKDGEEATSGTASTVKLTRETIHPSVWARMQAAPPPGEARYQPPALAGFTRERVSPAAAGESGYVWVDAKRNIRIPEHVIPCPLEKPASGEVDAFCLERKLIKGLLPELVKQLDEANGVHDPNPYVPGQPYETYKPDYSAAQMQADGDAVQHGFIPQNF